MVSCVLVVVCCLVYNASCLLCVVCGGRCVGACWLLCFCVMIVVCCSLRVVCCLLFAA